MYKNKENLFVDFKNLMIKSFDEDVKKIEFDLITRCELIYIRKT